MNFEVQLYICSTIAPPQSLLIMLKKKKKETPKKKKNSHPQSALVDHVCAASDVAKSEKIAKSMAGR